MIILFLFLSIIIFVTSLILIILKRKDKVLVSIGSIIITFLVFFNVFMYSTIPNEYKLTFFIILLFLFVLLIIYYSITISKNIENFSQGICMVNNGEFGYLDSDGNCIPKGCDAECDKRIQEVCPSITPEPSPSPTPNTINNVEDFTPSVCIYKDGECKNKFGIRDPRYFGKKCVSPIKYQKFLRENKNIRNIAREITPTLSEPNKTSCDLTNPKNLYQGDYLCKQQYGNHFGIKSATKYGCNENYKAICEEGYQLGVKLEPNSTKCVPLGTDMNQVCNQKFKNQEIFKPYLNIGSKEIVVKGCPQGTQRALCSGNYYDTEPISKHSTPCFPQEQDPNTKCKYYFNTNSTSIDINSKNCAPGFIRSICLNTS